MENDITINKEELIPHLKEEYASLCSFLKTQRQKLGGRYNWSNAYETLPQKFCTPHNAPERFADEVFLVLRKQSNLPAAVRSVVEMIGRMALKAALNAKLQQQEYEKIPTETKDS